MGEVHRALTRATKYLQSRGELKGMKAPAARASIIASFDRLEPAVTQMLRLLTAEDNALLLELCGRFRISTEVKTKQKDFAAFAKQYPQSIAAAKERKQGEPRPVWDGLFVASNAFLLSYEWRRLRMEALKLYGPRCQCCGATPATGAAMNVDHIKPRRLHPELALDINNLQILCHECNHGKGNWDATDWRTPKEA